MSALQEIANRSSTHITVNNIHYKIRKIQEIGTIEFCWIKAHEGIPGNEEADRAAKIAATLHKIPDFDLYPISYIKRLYRTETDTSRRNDYLTSTTGSHLKNWLPTLQDIQDFRKKTNISFQLTQILTGHGYHKSYLYRFKITADDLCPCDGITSQTIDHILKHCPKFTNPRFNYEIMCHNFHIDPYNLQDIILRESTTTSFCKLATIIVNSLKNFNGT
jgi:hypothetical protein